jgi:hypothetical protein
LSYEFFIQVFYSQLLCSTLQKTTDMACKIPKDLDLYLAIGNFFLKFIDVVHRAEVGYWAQRNFLNDYKIYVMVICMFDKDFLNSL